IRRSPNARSGFTSRRRPPDCAPSASRAAGILASRSSTRSSSGSAAGLLTRSGKSGTLAATHRQIHAVVTGHCSVDLTRQPHETAAGAHGRIERVAQQLRSMPVGVMIFLVYGFLVLAAVGVTTPLIINQAVESPISPIGVVWMLLLAYLIFTLTLTLQ